MHDIFLSYSRTDMDTMQKVKKIFVDARFKVVTVEKIQPGSDEWEHIARLSIRHSDVMVCILSPEAKLSRWVNLELMFARQFHKPTCLILSKGDEDKSVPKDYLNQRFFDIREENQFEEEMIHLIKVFKDFHPATIFRPAKVASAIIPLEPYESSSTGTLPIEFQRTVDRVNFLRDELSKGNLDPSELQFHLEECTIFVNNRWWMIGYKTGEWYSYNFKKGDWELDTPPTASEIESR